MRIVSRHRNSALLESDTEKNRQATLQTWFTQRFPLLWAGIVLVLIGLDILASISATTQRWGDINRQGIYFNIISIVIACAISALIARFNKIWWPRTMFALAVLPLPILAVTSGNITALCVAIALLSTMTWLGRVLVGVLLPECSQLEAWAIGGAFGIVGVGIIGFILGLFHALYLIFIAPILLIIFMVLIFLARKQLRGDIVALVQVLKRPLSLNPLPILLAGLLLGCIWLNIPGALAPEIRSDATRQRLVTAVHFANEGSFIPDDPDLNVANDTAFGEIAYAVPVALGSVQAAKLMHWFAGIFCAIAVFALGKRLGNTWSGVLAVVAFYPTLLIAYLSQTAYLDLFLALLAVAAALSIIAGKGTKTGAIVAAGVCIGAGVVIKSPFGYVAIGLAITTLIMAWGGGWYKLMRQVVLLALVAMLIALPWFIRSAALTHTLLLYLYFRTATFDNSQLGDLPSFGFGRALPQLLISPLTTTFLSVRFGGIQLGGATIWGGHIGFLPFSFLPFLVLIRKNKQLFALLIGTIGATLLWFYTAQHVRYLLPALALLCIGGAAAYVKTWQQIAARSTRYALNIVIAFTVVASIFIRAQLPETAHLYAIGLQSREDYLRQWLYIDDAGSYDALDLLNQETSATRVFAYTDGARLYSNVRISMSELAP